MMDSTGPAQQVEPLVCEWEELMEDVGLITDPSTLSKLLATVPNYTTCHTYLQRYYDELKAGESVISGIARFNQLLDAMEAEDSCIDCSRNDP